MPDVTNNKSSKTKNKVHGHAHRKQSAGGELPRANSWRNDMPDVTRAQIVASARTWIGTPYRHQASLKRVGCDCLGLIRGVWRDVIGVEPEQMQPYTPFWAEEVGRETLMEVADRFMVRIDEKPYRNGAPFLDGDLILLRMVQNGPAKHAAITLVPGKMIHAYAGHAVSENHIGTDWRRKIGAAYQFPGLVE